MHVGPLLGTAGRDRAASFRSHPPSGGTAGAPAAARPSPAPCSKAQGRTAAASLWPGARRPAGGIPM